LKNVVPFIRFPLMTAQEFVITVYPTQILSQKDVIDLFLYFNSDESARNDVARRIQYSVVPREAGFIGTVMSLYESKFVSLVPKHDYDDMMYLSGVESTLEFVFRSPEGENPFVKLCSLILNGLNYDLLRHHWPSGRIPCEENQVTVFLEALESGAAKEIFTSECLLSKGVELELKVQPRVTLKDGLKYRIRVKFLGETLVVTTQQGQRGHAHPNYDMLTSKSLKTNASEITSVGSVKFEEFQMILPLQAGSYYDKYHRNSYMKALGLHVVTGMRLSFLHLFDSSCALQ